MNAVIGFSFNLLTMQGLVGIISQNNIQYFPELYGQVCSLPGLLR